MAFRRPDSSVASKDAKSKTGLAQISDICAMAASAEGPAFTEMNLPPMAPNFVYRTLVPFWTEVNQFAPINTPVIIEFASLLMDQGNDRARAAFKELADRRSPLHPNVRRARLVKAIIDAINGTPTEPDVASPLNSLLTKRGAGKPIKVYPTDDLVERLYANSFGWDILEPFMRDDLVTDILVNEYNRVFVERRIKGGGTSGLVQMPSSFESPKVYRDFVVRLTSDMGRPIGVEDPMVDFILGNGARGNATLYSTREPSISIRRPQQQEKWTLDTYLRLSAMSPDMADYLRDTTLAGANLITYGEVGSGKTTLLSALIDAKPASKRIITAEDTYEILIDRDRHPDVVRMIVINAANEKTNMRGLVRNALRMRPDVLVVGETRDATAYDLLQALSVGAQGSMSTIHANGPVSAMDRLSTLILQSSLGMSEKSVRQMVVNAINILVYTRRLPNGKRVVWRIDEVVGFTADGKYDCRCVFRVRAVKKPNGDYAADFMRNPGYKMGHDLRVLFVDNGLDPSRWSASADDEEDEFFDTADEAAERQRLRVIPAAEDSEADLAPRPDSPSDQLPAGDTPDKRGGN